VSLDLVPSLADAVANASLGPAPGWLIIIGVGLFYAGLIYAYVRPMDDADEGGYGEVHV
jgi:uncharacterized membrane protein